MREIKAAGSEVCSKFIFSEVVGKRIDYLPLFLSSLRKPGRGSMQLQPSLAQVQRNKGVLLRFEGAKVDKFQGHRLI